MSTMPTPGAGVTTSPVRKDTRQTRLDARRNAARDGVRLLVGLLAVMWVVQIVNSVDSYKLDSHGIVPRSLSGLQGVVFSPFLHESWGHLIGNTIPFVILGLAIALEGLVLLAGVTVIVALVAGIGVWLIAGSHTDTVGASGVVFGYAGFLIARGFFNRKALQLALGAVVALAFGASLLSDLIPHHGVSWEGHLFGGAGGVIAARLIGMSPAAKKRTAAARAG